MPPTIRPARPTDLTQWLPLWEGYNTFYKRVIPEAVTRTTWARFFDGLEPMHAMVAEKDGQLIGLVHYLYHRNTTMLGPTCYLQDLFSNAAARGHGVGQALIEAVYVAAKAAGTERVYWQTHETNLIAQGLYDKVAERSGFIVYRRGI